VVAGGVDAALTQLVGRAADRVFRSRPAHPAVELPANSVLTHSERG